MEGNTGDDVYIVNNSGDTVVEAAGEGIDHVYSSLSSYTLGADLENLTYNGITGSFAGTGNALDNVIFGTARISSHLPKRISETRASAQSTRSSASAQRVRRHGAPSRLARGGDGVGAAALHARRRPEEVDVVRVVHHRVDAVRLLRRRCTPRRPRSAFSFASAASA